MKAYWAGRVLAELAQWVAAIGIAVVVFAYGVHVVHILDRIATAMEKCS